MSIAGERLRCILAWKKMKGAGLSRRLGLCSTTRQVQGWMNGLHGPGAKSIRRLSAALKIDEGYFRAPLIVTVENELLPLGAFAAAIARRGRRVKTGEIESRLPDIFAALARLSDAQLRALRDLARRKPAGRRGRPKSAGRGGKKRKAGRRKRRR